MSQIESMIAEVKREAVNTKKMLEQVPTEQFEYKPHSKSMSLKALATHIANLNGMAAGVINSGSSLDLAEMPIPEINRTQDIVHLMDQNSQATLEALKSLNEEDLDQPFDLQYNKQTIMSMPKGDFIRTMGMNHIYHHRAQLGVYLRILDIPVPGMYGPSADEKA